MDKGKVRLVKSAPIEEATHAYCPLCVCIQPVKIELLQPSVTPEDPRIWLSGDVVCVECKIVLVTMFKEST